MKREELLWNEDQGLSRNYSVGQWPFAGSFSESLCCSSLTGFGFNTFAPHALAFAKVCGATVRRPTE